MRGSTQRIEVTLETLLESVDLAEDITLRVAQSVGFDEEQGYRIGMSVREAVINAYTYGNLQDRRRRIFVVFELLPAQMVIHVRDQGAGFRLEDVPDPLAEENLLKTSGRGLFLIRAFMDELNVTIPQSGGAEVIMIKRYPAAPPKTHPGGATEA
ncbi:MAG TPA: ATP-binding protein [Patescibacteria group bacterium]|nr:ATP-binding protein [Patescibacteria group bacterium]